MTGSCCMKIRRDAGKRQPFTSCSEDHEVAVTVLQQCWWNVLTVFVFQGPLGLWLSEIAAMVRFPSLLRNVVKLVFIDLWDGDRAPWYSTCPACTAPYMFNSSSPRWPVLQCWAKEKESEYHRSKPSESKGVCTPTQHTTYFRFWGSEDCGFPVKNIYMQTFQPPLRSETLLAPAFQIRDTQPVYQTTKN